MKDEILRLHGKVQNYTWGGADFIPDLVGIQKQPGKTYAEYWMGAHPSAPSFVKWNGKEISLDKLIHQQPSTFISDDVYKRFGELPYLFKVLDVKEMLSIQVHPTIEEAIKGYDAEEAAGISLTAENRNYKDKNHKPEVMVALSEFWLLHGFKTHAALLQTLNDVPELNFCVSIFSAHGYYGLYKYVMELPQPIVDEILLPLVHRELSGVDQLTRKDPGFWINKLFQDKPPTTNIDRGIFSIYFFNIMQVQPGEAVFQGAGIPHAYLEGQNVELMANSDNVLRGGLTHKYVDVAELLKHTSFEGIEPHILTGEVISDFELNYPCPVDDFGIGKINIDINQTYKATALSGEIYLVINGSVNIKGTQETFTKGQAFYVLPNTELSLSTKASAVLYKAFVPVSSHRASSTF